MQPQQKSKRFIQDLNSIKNIYLSITQSLSNNKQFKIGNFVILQRLGGGNYGQVYKAIHIATQKYFAIKIIDKQKVFRTIDEYVKSVLKRLLQTQGVLMQLCDSPNIIKCYDIIQNQKYKIFILEYCNRKSLHDQLKKRKSYPLNQALAIFKQIINGISELHRNNIIHRDLKPENIMINNGTYKIADFGFCKKIQQQNKIGNFTVLGTRTTMAPEVKNRQKYGIKADVWSLGIIFYTMICSNVNYYSQGFTGRSNDINNQIKKGSQLYFETVDGQPDQLLKDFIKSMLKIKQEQRISWKQLKNHKIFKQSNSNIYMNPVLNPTGWTGFQQPKIQDSVLQVYEDKLPTQQDLRRKRQKQRESNRNLKDKKKQKQLQVQDQIRKQLNQTIHIQITQMKQGFNLKLEVKDDIEKQQKYKKIQLNNLQCLKAIYIYQKIILILQSQKMLDLKKRSHYELLYLLINRCYINVSWTNNHLERNADDQMFLSHHTQILSIYNNIKNKWQEIESKLRELTNTMTQKIKDVKNFFFKHQKQKNINIYFGGIENLDYEKNKQIQYTQNQYIEKILDQLKGQPHKLHQMKTKLRCYKKINQIQLKDLEEIDFYQKFKEILVKGA